LVILIDDRLSIKLKTVKGVKRAKMKKLISFSLFLSILLIMLLARSVQAKEVKGRKMILTINYD